MRQILFPLSSCTSVDMYVLFYHRVLLPPHATGAGNAETLSLLLEVGQGQDVNTICFRGFTPLDYVNKTLSWLETSDPNPTRPLFFDDFNLVFSRNEDIRRRVKQKYVNCRGMLKKFGAVERTDAKVSVEQTCRDMTFSGARGGAYSVAAATPFAAVRRLTSFLFYSKEDAELLLLTYKAYISPSELLRLFKIRFYQLNNLPEKALALCDAVAVQLGVSFDDIEQVGLRLVALEDSTAEEGTAAGGGGSGVGEGGGKEEKDLAESMRQQSLVRKRGDSITAKDAGKKNFIKGVETSLQPSRTDDDESFTVQNTCIGKIYNGDEKAILRKLLSCLARCFDGVEIVSNTLILRESGRYFNLENLSMSRVFKDSTSWSCRLAGDSSQPSVQVPGVTAAQAPCQITSLSLRCKPAHKMMRGKAVFELQASFSDQVAGALQLEEAVVAGLKDEMCLMCAKVLYGFACDAFSPDIPLLRAPRLLASRSTIDMFEEASDAQCRGEMEALQSCQQQLVVLENEFNRQESEGTCVARSTHRDIW
jgi:hypothetical protein